MTKLKVHYTEYDELKKRWFITLEERSGLFGLVKKYIDYVDSDYVFKQEKTKIAFYRYPEMECLQKNDPRTQFLTDVLRRLVFEKTGEIIK